MIIYLRPLDESLVSQNVGLYIETLKHYHTTLYTIIYYIFQDLQVIQAP